MNPYEMKAADARRRELAGAPVPLGSIVVFALAIILGLIL